MEAVLFKDNERLRESNGRFCTRDRFLTERTANENKVLRFERDKYKRAYLALADENSRLRREIEEIKQRIKVLV